MYLNDFTILADNLFPPHIAMEGDPIGLQIRSARNTAHNIHVAFEVTNDVITEAEHNNADLLVVFHPLIFRPLTTLGTDLRVPNLVRRLVKSDIALFVIHTNYDTHPRGTSYQYAQALKLTTRRFVVPSATPGYGMGIIATVDTPLAMDELLQRVQNLSERPLCYCSTSKPISTIAIVGGSGIGFMEEAIEQGAEVLVTADIKYHDYHAATGRIGLIDAGHFEMEQFVPHGITTILAEHLTQSTITTSTVITNPILYHSPLQIDISTPLSGSL